MAIPYERGRINKLKRNLHKYGCFLLCLFILCTLLPVPVNAEGTESGDIRVGWYEDSYNITGKNGERSGYGYEYQQSVASYTGWSYEMMENGQIDLISGVSYTEERAENSRLPADPWN